MKSLKPSMRENKRYLLVKGLNLNSNIEKAIKDFIGISGMTKVGFGWIESKENLAIISINREMVDIVRASLCIWPEKMEVLRVSGTLKGLRKK